MLPVIPALVPFMLFAASLASPTGDEHPSATSTSSGAESPSVTSTSPGATSSSATSTPEPPNSYAVVLFPGFASLDIFGPLGALELVTSQNTPLDLLAETLGPVSNTIDRNSTFSQSVVSTSTFDDFLSGDGVDVLIVPGGPGVRVPDEELEPVVEFVREAYPKVKYLITICTGASIAARAGILDDKRATTNKASWDGVTALGPEVEWVSPARWVVDGNIWSSSGVMSGLDLTAEFIRQMYGEELAENAFGVIEHEPHPQDYDPFAEMFDVPPSP